MYVSGSAQSSAESVGLASPVPGYPDPLPSGKVVSLALPERVSGRRLTPAAEADEPHVGQVSILAGVPFPG